MENFYEIGIVVNPKSTEGNIHNVKDNCIYFMKAHNLVVGRSIY